MVKEYTLYDLNLLILRLVIWSRYGKYSMCTYKECFLLLLVWVLYRCQLNQIYRYSNFLFSYFLFGLSIIDKIMDFCLLVKSVFFMYFEFVIKMHIYLGLLCPYDQLATLLWNSPLYLSSHSFLCNLHSLVISHSSFLKIRVNTVYLSLACMFNLFVFLYLKWTIYKQHMAE